MAGPVEQQIRRWLEECVVGLELCPFARPLLGARKLRIAICEQDGSSEDALYRAFLQELDYLQSHREEDVATTLIVYPGALQNFDDFLAFTEQANELLDAVGLRGHIQVASFHPDYQFAGEPPEAASHYSNRAPYPALHLLRENMMSRVLEDYPEPELIPARNVERLNSLGSEELARRWRKLFL